MISQSLKKQPTATTVLRIKRPDEDVPACSETSSPVAGCQSGDSEVFRQLYELHQEKVHRIATRMVGQNDAPDVAQLVFLTVFRSIHRFRGDSKFETWLYRIVVNECLQHLRRNRRWHPRCLDWDPTDHFHSDAAENRELLDTALAKVDPELRAIFLLREVEQLAYAEIAAVLDMSEGTVASRLNRARCELQIALRKLGWQPG